MDRADWTCQSLQRFDLTLARRHDRSQIPGDLRHLFLDHLEVVGAHRHGSQGGRHPDGPHPSLEPQERDLAHHVSGSERLHGLAVLRDLGRALLDHEHLVRDRSLFEQDLALRHLDLPDVVRDRREIVVIELAEEREPAEAFDVHGHAEIRLLGRNVPWPSVAWNPASSTRTLPRCRTTCGSPFTRRPS